MPASSGWKRAASASRPRGDGRVEGRGGQGGGPDDDPRRGRPGQRPAAATLLAEKPPRFSMKGPFSKRIRGRTILACASPPRPCPTTWPSATRSSASRRRRSRSRSGGSSNWSIRSSCCSVASTAPGARASIPTSSACSPTTPPEDVAEGTAEEPPESEDAKPKRQLAAHGAAEAPRGPAPEAGRVRAVRRGVALPGLRARADQDRRRDRASSWNTSRRRSSSSSTRDSATPAAPARSTSPSRTSRRSRSTRGCPARVSWPRRSRASISDHLPLYRLEDIFARHGVELSRATLCGWMASCAELLTPLYDLMVKRVRLSIVIHTDVLD